MAEGIKAAETSVFASRLHMCGDAVAAPVDAPRVTAVEDRSLSGDTETSRLLVVSNKARNCMVMQTAALPCVTYIQYKYDSNTLDSIAASITQHLGKKKVNSMAFVFHSNSSSIYISGKDEKAILTKDGNGLDEAVRCFFSELLERHLEGCRASARLDILACGTAQNPDNSFVAHEMSKSLSLPVAISKDLMGCQLPGQRDEEDGLHKIMYVGDLYFRMERLRNWSGNNRQTLAGFEKIRTVGKGAYGTAVLYKKKDDNSLVILKELNLHDMNASERNMALNEVRVLAMMDHPNIISYYDSFEEDGTVIIEMEYADGGTLAKYLSQQVEPLGEREVLGMFQQMVAAIKYIHEHNILHRDLKTANIFLTKEGAVKVGDFGISKLMSTTNQAASTVLGTPYYISPEMCEAKPYRDKSDIWALGCILYEMVCKQRTFEGSNLPALVNKIMKGHFAPVKGSYSQPLKDLIENLLQNNPQLRPSAAEIWTNKLPELLSRYEDPLTDYEDDLMTSSDNAASRRKRTSSHPVLEKRSVLYYFEMAHMSLQPTVLPSRMKIREVAVGADHVIVVSTERMVYTWGSGARGQLGHGDNKSHPKPLPVQALKGKSIIKACCGDGFSVFVSDNGIVMTCGDGSAGCLAHGDWSSCSRPRLIEALLSVDVTHIACGPRHVVALGNEREVFTWGDGGDGRLGLGSDDHHCLPMKVSFAETVCVRGCYCGDDGTMLLSDVGTVLACGNNDYNKLGLNQRQGFLMAMKNIFNKTVPGEHVFTVVKSLVRHRVVGVAMGRHHSAVLVEAGRVYTLGRNSEGQLGTGNARPQSAPVDVRVFDDRPALHVRCGEFYTVAATVDNDLLFWGTRFKVMPSNEEATPKTRPEEEPPPPDTASPERSSSHLVVTNGTTDQPAEINRDQVVTIQEDLKDDVIDDTTDVTSVTHDTEADVIDDDSSGDVCVTTSVNRGFRPLSSSRPHMINKSDVFSGNDTELVLQPTPLIRMDSSGSRSEAGDTVTLSDVLCHAENLFIQVETTAPPPRRKSRRKRGFRRRFAVESSTMSPRDASRGARRSASSRDGGDEYSSEASELDTRGSLPTWLRHELASCETADRNDGNDADVTTDDESSPLLRASRHKIRANAPLERVNDAATVKNSLKEDIEFDARSSLKPTIAILDKTNARQKHASRHDNTSSERHAGRHDNTSSERLSSDGVIAVKTDASDRLLSSSSSSDALATSLALRPEKVSAAKTKHAVAKCLASVAAPYKSKAGPLMSEKPVGRHRAQGKTKRSDSGVEVTKGNSLMAGQKTSLEQLQVELSRLALQKTETEARMTHIEQENKRQREIMITEAGQRSEEKEKGLKQEVASLRRQLAAQGHKLEDNENVVVSLQEQLTKLQHDHERAHQSMQETAEKQASLLPPQRESRICVLQ